VYWLRGKSIVIVRKVKPKAIEAGQISKGLLVTATRKIKTVERGGRLGQEEKPKVIQVEQPVEKISSTILSRIIEKVKEQASRFISDELFLVIGSATHDLQQCYSNSTRLAVVNVVIR
jgi:hypothetical protein